MESTSRPGRERMIILSIFVVAVVFVAISLTVLWSQSPTGPALEAEINVINFYDQTLLPPKPGHLVIQLTIDVANYEDEAVPLDPSDFLLETIDGQILHFAFRFGNYTVIYYTGAGNGFVGMPAELPAGLHGNIWVPFEIPMNMTLRSLTWRSSFGDVTSEVPGNVNQSLVQFYENMWTG